MGVTIARTRDDLRDALASARSDGQRIALVPTMGAVHDGHVRLVETAVRNADTVVASIFVNPTQFGPGEDYERYPRTFDRDIELLSGAGVDIVFAPDVETVYPPGTEDVVVEPGPLGQVLEGAIRPTHFRGVLTVVAKLFALVRPDVAVFGEKDYQQLVLIRRLARAMHTGVEVLAAPTVREGDGLALSSRNAYLSADERAVALVLSQALRAGADAGGRGASAVLAATYEHLDGVAGVEVDYVALTDPELRDPRPGEARLLIAARVGATRLIDNIGLQLAAGG